MADNETQRPEVIAQVEAMSYSPIPLDTLDRSSWAVWVEYRGEGRWAVINGSRAYSTAGKWDYEPISSSRTDEWLDEHRFDFGNAQRIAYLVCGDVTWNGRTADQIAAKHLAAEPVGAQQDGNQP